MRALETYEYRLRTTHWVNLTPRLFPRRQRSYGARRVDLSGRAHKIAIDQDHRTIEVISVEGQLPVMETGPSWRVDDL